MAKQVKKSTRTKQTFKPEKMWAVIDKDDQTVESVHVKHDAAKRKASWWQWWKVVPVLVTRVK